jgi:hypothetical protein
MRSTFAKNEVRPKSADEVRQRSFKALGIGLIIIGALLLLANGFLLV